jgi:serine/threonine protein kinase
MDASRYERIKIIGKGSFGQAFLVKSTASQKLYVLKEIKLKLADKTDKTQQKAVSGKTANIERFLNPSFLSRNWMRRQKSLGNAVTST